MSYELPNISRVSLAKNLDGDRSKKERKEKSGLSVVTSLGETKDGRRGLEVDPAPLGHYWTIGDCCSLGGMETDLSHPTTGLRHYRPQ